MSGPKSLQRASSCCCCCCQHQNRHRSCHHYHCRRHCHRRRTNDDYTSTSVVENGDERRVRNSTYSRTRINNNGDVRLTYDDRSRDESSDGRVARDDEIYVRDEARDQTRFYGEKYNGDRVDVEIDDYSSSPKYERLGTSNDDRHECAAGVVSKDDTRLSWQIHCRDDDLITRRQRRDTCRRNGGQRGIASNIFLLATAGAFLALAIVAPPVSGTSSEKDEASRPRMGGTGTGTALASSPPNVRAERVPVVDTRTTSTGTTGSGADITGSIDLLAALQLYNTTRTGVTQVPGLARLKPAYYLQGEERDLRLNEASFERAAALLRRVPEFTVAAALRQEEANSGTIVAFSHGNNRYLELQSSGRKDELRLHYVSRRDGTVHVEAFPFRLADGAWHRLALSISGSQVELLVDCHPLYRRLLRPGPPDTNFTLPQLQLWVGQRNAKHFLFKGALQDVKLIPGAHGYLSQCPQLDSSCPTCGQFSILQNTVEQLMHNLNELTRRLAAAEGRISKVEECECQKSCRANGTVHEDGATWEKGCEQCSCVHGDIECRPTPCAPVTCKYPIIPPGQCCPICLKQCYLRGVIYDHGEKVSPKQCVECDCFDGVFTCQRFDTETACPPLPCPASEQISVAEECCKFCPDVDECKQQGGSEGHHCNANTRCVNVVGSYTCECLPGYHRVDKFNCAELDECATGRHSCAEHATCINTAGSYYCVCNDGYAGDGYTCKPVCEQSCQNGGECMAPGRCSCRRGYIGNSCELDLDECASDLHRCHRSSTCFNMPGWYYCRCKPGYRSALHESNQGTQCLDIDECNDQTIERRHTCHPSARCVNTEGGYECSCKPDEQRHSAPSAGIRDSSSSTSLSQDGECRLSCWYEGREVANGETLAPIGNPCRRCTCKDGVITCREPICDCSAPASRRDKCCPQCDPAASCRHQELHHLVFRSGERWIYQCQTCECLYGEIDCWQMECPPITCSNPVTEDGDCCPRCEDDPCARELPGVSSANNASALLLVLPLGQSQPQPCSYAGLLHESGTSWQDLHDKCTTCECKDGQLCCSYDYRCAGDLEDKQQSRVASGESLTSAVPSGPDVVRQNLDSSKATLSTSMPEHDEKSSSNGNATLGKKINEQIRTRRARIRTTTNSLSVGNSDSPTDTDDDRSDTSEDTGRTSRLSESSPMLRTSGDQVGSTYTGENNDRGSRRTTLETPSSSDNERAALSLSATTPSSTSTSTTTATTTTTTTTTTTPKTSASLGGAAAVAAAAAAPISFKALNNIQTARYSTSNPNERKTSFASDRRRIPERGPRLINGNPTGHDAT